MRNSIIASRNQVDEAWSGIDVQLKRRHDLVPNLVEAVKGYATHERETFEKVTQARSQAMAAQGVDQTAKAESALSGALGGLRVVAEQYPELRATENFQQLQNQLSELEDEIQASRRIYNSNVQSYNTKIQQFPMSIVANQGGFTDKEFFEIERRRRARGAAGQLRPDAIGYLALGIYVLYSALVFGLRMVIQLRRTGSTGLKGISGSPGSVEWFSGIGFALAVASVPPRPSWTSQGSSIRSPRSTRTRSTTQAPHLRWPASSSRSSPRWRWATRGAWEWTHQRRRRS